jgi:hypothetical protein
MNDQDRELVYKLLCFCTVTLKENVTCFASQQTRCGYSYHQEGRFRSQTFPTDELLQALGSDTYFLVPLATHLTFNPNLF